MKRAAIHGTASVASSSAAAESTSCRIWVCTQSSLPPVEARSAAFHSAGRSYRPKALRRVALCLSRYAMALVQRYNRVRFAQLLAGRRRSLRAV